MSKQQRRIEEFVQLVLETRIGLKGSTWWTPTPLEFMVSNSHVQSLFPEVSLAGGVVMGEEVLIFLN